MYQMPGRDVDPESVARRRRIAQSWGDSGVDPLLWPEGTESRIDSIASSNQVRRELSEQFENFQDWPEDEWRTAMARALSRSGYPATAIMLAQAGSNQRNTAIAPRRIDYLAPAPFVEGFYSPRPNFSTGGFAQSARRAGVDLRRGDILVSRPFALGHEQYHRLQRMRGLHYDSQLIRDIDSVLEKHGGKIQNGFSFETIPNLLSTDLAAMPVEVRQSLGNPRSLPWEDRLRIFQSFENYLRRNITSADYERADQTLPGANNMYGRPSYR